MSRDGVVEQALIEAVRLQPEQDVLVLGGGSLPLAAHELVGDGWVYVVRSQVDELEELLEEAHAVGASGIAITSGTSSTVRTSTRTPPPVSGYAITLASAMNGCARSTRAVSCRASSVHRFPTSSSRYDRTTLGLVFA